MSKVASAAYQVLVNENGHIYEVTAHDEGLIDLVHRMERNRTYYSIRSQAGVELVMFHMIGSGLRYNVGTPEDSKELIEVLLSVPTLSKTKHICLVGGTGHTHYYHTDRFSPDGRPGLYRGFSPSDPGEFIATWGYGEDKNIGFIIAEDLKEGKPSLKEAVDEQDYHQIPVAASGIVTRNRTYYTDIANKGVPTLFMQFAKKKGKKKLAQEIIREMFLTESNIELISKYREKALWRLLYNARDADKPDFCPSGSFHYNNDITDSPIEIPNPCDYEHENRLWLWVDEIARRMVNEGYRPTKKAMVKVLSAAYSPPIPESIRLSEEKKAAEAFQKEEKIDTILNRMSVQKKTVQIIVDAVSYDVSLKAFAYGGNSSIAYRLDWERVSDGDKIAHTIYRTSDIRKKLRKLLGDNFTIVG